MLLSQPAENRVENRIGKKYRDPFNLIKVAHCLQTFPEILLFLRYLFYFIISYIYFILSFLRYLLTILS